MKNENNNKMIVYCPHCFEPIEILELNCRIFRHAIYKHNYQQIDPHMSQKDCEDLIKQGVVYGCAKPFQILDEKAEKCDYI